MTTSHGDQGIENYLGCLPVVLALFLVAVVVVVAQ
jgi:hypothetical protein